MVNGATTCAAGLPDRTQVTPDPEPLLPLLHGIIERSFGMKRVVEDAARYLIGDRGLRRYAGLENAVTGHAVDPGGGLRACLLVRPASDPVRVALYFPDRMIRHLERHDPRWGLDDGNIDAFAMLVEELDHLLT